MSAKFQKRQAEVLVGRTIKQLIFTEEGYPVIVLDNGLHVWVQADGEGNGPGSLSISDSTGAEIDLWRQS